MPLAIKKSNERTLNNQIEAILSEGDEDLDLAAECRDNKSFLRERLLRFGTHLEYIVEGLFEEAPRLRKTIRGPTQRTLRFASYHTIIAHGQKRRDLKEETEKEPYFYFIHPYKVAQIVARALEETGVKRDNILLPLFVSLYHDIVEERVDSLLTPQTPVIKAEVKEEKLTAEERALLETFSALGQAHDLEIPEKLVALDQYQGTYRARLFPEEGEQTSDPLREALLKHYSEEELETQLDNYFQVLNRYAKAVREEIAKREGTLIEEQLGVLKQELEVSLSQRSIKKKLPSGFLEGVVRSIKELTRVSLELYYKACAKLLPKDREASSLEELTLLIVKYADRLANCQEVDRIGREEGIDYFTFTDEERAVELAELIEKGKHEELEQIVDELLEDSSQLTSKISIHSLLEISPEIADLQTRATIDRLDQAIYEITSHNSSIHQPEKRRRQRIQREKKEAPSKMISPERMYEVYKCLILINHTRRHYQGRETPAIIKYMMDELIEVSERELDTLIEGTFSNHCLRFGTFSLNQAREDYWTIVEYDLKYDGFSGVTQELPEERRGKGFNPDGTIKRVLDQQVRGAKYVADPLYQDKGELFGTLLALRRLTYKFKTGDSFYIKGITDEGIEPAEPAVLNNGGKRDGA